MPFEEGDIVKYPDYDRLFIIRSTYIEEDTASSSDDISITGEYVTEEGKIEIVGLQDYFKLEIYKGELSGVDRKLLVLQYVYRHYGFDWILADDFMDAMKIIDYEHLKCEKSRGYEILDKFGIDCDKYINGGK